jgi:stage II sporulation protein D
MQQGVGSVAFTGAGRAAGRRLAPTAVYRATPAGRAHVTLSGPRGRVATVAAPLVVTPASAAMRLYGSAENGRRDGRYRGSFALTPDGGGLDAIDVVGLDDYTRGVVAAESDASWPLAELEAQAVASRTYAITDTGHAGFDVYADTRSQQYAGVAAETPATDKAVAATAGEVVTYQAHPVITFFFDSSGGQTENVEDAFPGSPPQPWLVSVADPYDTLAPRHRFSLSMPLGTAQSRLHVRGRLLRIVVTQRGKSPRVVKATVVGSGGSSTVSGLQLQSSLGLATTWACFAVTGASGAAPAGWDAPCMPSSLPGSTPALPPLGPASPSGATGGTGAPPGG